MHPEAAHLPSPQNARKIAPPPEKWIGDKVARLAATLAYGAIWQDGKPTREVTRRGIEQIAEIVPFMLCFPDFHAVARREGSAELRRHCESNLIELDEAWIDQLIEATLGIVSKIVKKTSN
jgi:hypothetical protein